MSVRVAISWGRSLTGGKDMALEKFKARIIFENIDFGRTDRIKPENFLQYFDLVMHRHVI
jgi:hypothetical protein